MDVKFRIKNKSCSLSGLYSEFGELSMRQGAFVGKHLNGENNNFKPVFITVLDNFEGNMIGLDAATGAGFTAVKMAQKISKVYALELTPNSEYNPLSEQLLFFILNLTSICASFPYVRCVSGRVEENFRRCRIW